MWILAIVTMTTPFMQSGFATSEACVAGYQTAKQSVPLINVQQASCMSEGKPTVWIIRDGVSVAK